MTQWFLERKLYRSTLADFVRITCKIIAIRFYSATACFISMLLMAWIGALVRAIDTHDGHVFRTMDKTSLLIATEQASKYQGHLLPVLLSWAVLLLLTPAGYTYAFRVAVTLAGVLGYLELSPPAFWVTARVRPVSHWLSGFDGWYAALFAGVLVAVACVLQFSAASTFRRLGHVSGRPRRVRRGGSSFSLGLVRRLCAMPLVLLMLLQATWAATVIRLAAAYGPRGTGMSYGFQGGLYQDKILLVLVLVAVLISLMSAGAIWLTVALVLTAFCGLAPDTLTIPVALEIPAGRGELTHLGTAWGAGALWAALFVFIPVVTLGMRLVAKLLH